jgi:hypothetical protein
MPKIAKSGPVTPRTKRRTRELRLVETPREPAKDPVSQTLRNAVEAAGGVQALAGVLEVDSKALEEWLEGSSPPPSDVLLKAADLVYRKAVATLQRANRLKK